jgi:GxxExxY protein
MCLEMDLRNIAYRSQVQLPLQYKGVQTERGYVIDLLIQGSLIVEIKSVEKLLPIHSSQLLTYMKLQKVSAGLLINFNVETLLQGLRRILR